MTGDTAIGKQFIPLQNSDQIAQSEQNIELHWF